MASLSPSTINNLTIPQNPQIISNNNLGRRSKKSIISCKNHNNKNENPNNKTPILDRRNMLIGLGGLYGSTLPLTTKSPANAEPMAPDVYRCTDAEWGDSVGDYCCPPKFPDEIKEFRFRDYPTVFKERRPAHLASRDPDYVHDYNRAISIMRTGLTPFDPRNFYEQAKIHCAYCDAWYPQLNNPDKRMEVHKNWLFASFHRWYLYFFERIMGKMINKPDFALPFWNWDHPDGMRMPEMFKDVNSSLYDPNRVSLPIKMSIESSYESSHNSGVEEQPRKCLCGVPVAILTSGTNDNPGRRFEKCKFSNPTGGMVGCRWFRWHDRVQTEWQKEIINKLKMEKRLVDYEVGCLSREIQWLKEDRKKLQFEIENLKNKAFMAKYERRSYCCSLSMVVFACMMLIIFRVVCRM